MNHPADRDKWACTLLDDCLEERLPAGKKAQKQLAVDFLTCQNPDMPFVAPRCRLFDRLMEAA